MSLVRLATYFFWIVPAAVEASFIAVMMWRKIYRQLPFFFAYACFDVSSSAFLFVIFHWFSYKAYFVDFWIVKGISLLLGLLVIREVILYVFRQYELLHDLSALLFRWVTIILVMVAVLTAAAAPGADSDRMLSAFLVIERSVRLIQVGLLLFLFLFSNYFGLSWRHYAFGVALGFGTFAGVQVAAIAVRTSLGVISNNAFSLISSAGQSCAVLIWWAYLVIPQRHASIEVLPKANLEQWNQALSELLHR